MGVLDDRSGIGPGMAGFGKRNGNSSHLRPTLGRVSCRTKPVVQDHQAKRLLPPKGAKQFSGSAPGPAYDRNWVDRRMAALNAKGSESASVC
jgi:hypothetical protein